MTAAELATFLAELSGVLAMTPETKAASQAAMANAQSSLAKQYQEEQEEVEKKQKGAGVWGTVGQVAGTVLGTAIGGPALGATAAGMIGGTVGGAAGSALGGSDDNLINLIGKSALNAGMSAVGSLGIDKVVSALKSGGEAVAGGVQQGAETATQGAASAPAAGVPAGQTPPAPAAIQQAPPQPQQATPIDYTASIAPKPQQQAGPQSVMQQNQQIAAQAPSQMPTGNANAENLAAIKGQSPLRDRLIDAAVQQVPNIASLIGRAEPYVEPAKRPYGLRPEIAAAIDQTFEDRHQREFDRRMASEELGLRREGIGLQRQEIEQRGQIAEEEIGVRREEIRNRKEIEHGRQQTQRDLAEKREKGATERQQAQIKAQSDYLDKRFEYDRQLIGERNAAQISMNEQRLSNQLQTAKEIETIRTNAANERRKLELENDPQRQIAQVQANIMTGKPVSSQAAVQHLLEITDGVFKRFDVMANDMVDDREARIDYITSRLEDLQKENMLTNKPDNEIKRLRESLKSLEPTPSAMVRQRAATGEEDEVLVMGPSGRLTKVK